MSGDEEQPPESLLPYDEWTEEARRHVVSRAIGYAAKHGLPGEHHFYITFRTDHLGVVIPPHLRAQYPDVMTIVLQHQFWDLRMDTDAMSVGLSFGGIPTTLVIPLAAVTAFADPQVRFGLQFSATEPAPTGPVETVPAQLDEGGKDPLPEPAPEPQVVSLDAFRRRTPPRPEN